MDSLIDDLKEENQNLLKECDFAEKLMKYIENYRNLVNISINSCENCAKNEELIHRFSDLELNYNRDFVSLMNFAKQKHLILNNINNNSINDSIIESLLSQKKEMIETKVDLIDYNESDLEDTDEDQELADADDRDWRQTKAPKTGHKRASKGGKRKKYDKLYKCDFCDYTHKKLPNLESHKNKMHLNVRPFKCDKCEKTFTGKPILAKHIKKVHSESDSVFHYCDWTECKFKTKYWNNLKEHRMRHTGDRQFKCVWPGCEQSFYNNKEATQHMKSHEEAKDYRCDWPGCGASFKRHVYLSRHKLLHTCPDTLHPCVWPGCGKSFNTRKKLGKHMAVHKKPIVAQTVKPVPLARPLPPLFEPKTAQYPFDLSQRGPTTQMAVRWPPMANIH